ncbi:MAG: TetR/AcrR family transcriptional regulator [Desulfobacteraceae bacterium]|jgi:AcrR family transcriptional regulator
MKISQEQKKANRKALIRAAAELIADKGFKTTTMRKIAKAANLADATIYNYFPTKEAILYAYYQEHLLTCIEELKAVPDFSSFTLQEQLQTLFDTSLALYLPDREFVDQTFRLVLLGAGRDWEQIKPIRNTFLMVVNDMLSAAMEVKEIPPQVFEELIGQFFLDAYIGAMNYWLMDTSENFNNTSVLIDRGLNLSCAMLKAGIANKIFDISVFLFKTHILSKMDIFFDPVKSARHMKRKFMEQMHDD